MKTVVMPIHKKWFDMILYEDKKEEYRKIGDYWRKRLKKWREKGQEIELYLKKIIDLVQDSRRTMTERELQDKFVIWLNSKKKDNEHIFEELDKIDAMTDVVLYSKHERIGYELKLKNYKKAIEQCQKNTLSYNRNFIVMPLKEINKILEIQEEPYKTASKTLGLIAYDNDSFNIIRKSKETFLHERYKWQVMDRIIRGFYKGGVNGRDFYR